MFSVFFSFHWTNWTQTINCLPPRVVSFGNGFGRPRCRHFIVIIAEKQPTLWLAWLIGVWLNDNLPHDCIQSMSGCFPRISRHRFFIFSPNANSSPPTHSHTHTWSDPAVAHKFRIWITVNCDVSFFEPKSTTTTTTIKRGSTDANVQHDNLRRPLPTTGSENSTDVNPTTRHSVYSVIIGGFFYWTSLFCTNQASVQKCMSLKSLNKAKKAIYFAILGKFQLLLCSRW